MALLDIYPLSDGELAVYDGASALTGPATWMDFDVARSTAEATRESRCERLESASVRLLGTFAWDGGFDATLELRSSVASEGCADEEGTPASTDVTLRYVGTGQRLEADAASHGSATHARFDVPDRDTGWVGPEETDED